MLGRMVELPQTYRGGVVVSRFGVIPKQGQPNQWRLILDLSSPAGASVNDGVSTALSSLHYVTVEDAVRRILLVGQGALLAKVDIKQAYRNVPIHPDDRHLLGMEWQGRLFIDKTLPFGLRSAPKIFTALADAVQWIAQARGVEWLVHYIDDFLTVGCPNSDQCYNSLRCLQSTCADLVFPLKEDKVVGPSTTLEFLGITIDTDRMEVRLPPDKVIQLELLLGQWAVKRLCRKRELLSLIGKLAHACKIVRVGRIFLRRFIECSTRAAHLDHWLHLSLEFRADIGWWQVFIQAWSHRQMMHFVNKALSPEVSFSSDASGSWGCGAIWGSHWLQWQWSGQWAAQHITVKELVPIVLACAVWGRCWRYQHVLVWCDNMAVVHVLHSLTSRDPAIMHLLRCLYYYLALYNIHLEAKHVHNSVADSISRNSMQVFRQLAPLADGTPTAIPPVLQQLLSPRHQDWLLPAWRALLRTSSLAA